MPIDWDTALLGAVHGVFGEPVIFMPSKGVPFPIDGVFDRAYLAVSSLGDGTTMSTAMPMLGVRMALFPSDAPPVQGDQLQILSSRATYRVKDVQADGHGEAKLLLTFVRA
jgi:hypothetical protein